jgi:hypothetical protein
MADGSSGDQLKGGCSMRIRHDLVFISSVLFTIALACFIPFAWWNVLSGYHNTQGLDVWERTALLLYSEVGELTLALVFIGFIVTWTGYLNKLRWTWFVMFILVSGLTFQTDMLPFVLHPKLLLDAPELFVDAWKGEPIAARGFLEGFLIFSLMVIALFLPVRSFFSRRTSPTV